MNTFAHFWTNERFYRAIAFKNSIKIISNPKIERMHKYTVLGICQLSLLSLKKFVEFFFDFFEFLNDIDLSHLSFVQKRRHQYIHIIEIII